MVLLAAAGLLAESAAGVRWTAPATCKPAGPRPMRAATYSIAPADGDRAAAECVVNYFGPGQGGGVDANVERWKGQVLGADGKPAAARVTRRTVSGVPMTVVDATGTYTGMGGPMMGGSTPAARYRLLGALVEGSGGHVFFKLTGPAKTIAAQEKNFEQLLSSIKPDR